MYEVIVNPAGASGQARDKWKHAKRIFDFRKIPYREHFSTQEKGIKEIARELTLPGGERTLVVVGGDGSLNQVVNGIVDFEGTTIGFIPCGSGNDLARSLNIPLNVPDSVDIICRGNTRLLDIGEATLLDPVDGDMKPHDPVTWRFNISCGIGFDAEICEMARRSKWKDALNRVHLGKLIYIGVALKQIFVTKKSKGVVVEDGRKKDFDDLLLVVAMIQPYEGGGFMFAPEASASDGKFDICIADGLSRNDFFRIFPSAYSGNHVMFNGVYIDRARKAEFHMERQMWVHADGETEFMAKNVSLRVMEERLKLIV